MGEWGKWGPCECDNEEDGCGTCKELRFSNRIKEGVHPGNTSCKTREEEENDCSIACRKFY